VPLTLSGQVRSSARRLIMPVVAGGSHGAHHAHNDSHHNTHHDHHSHDGTSSANSLNSGELKRGPSANSPGRTDPLPPEHKKKPAANVIDAFALAGNVSNTADKDGHWFIDHLAFKLVIYGMILLNTLQIGVATDNQGGKWTPVWAVFENMFTAVFLIEMIIKVYLLRRRYPADPWNCLDGFIVVMAVLEGWIIPAFVEGETGMPDLLVLRAVRMVRIVRMVKLLKVFRQLLILIEGIISSLQSMVWVTILLMFVLYICAIFTVDLIGRAEYPGTNAVEDELVMEAIGDWNNALYFGTVSRAMFSLFSVCLLAEWAEIGRPVLEHQPLIFPFFIFFVIFTTLGILNVIVGVIVENTMAATSMMRDEDLARECAAKLQKVKLLRDVLWAIDTDGNCELSLDEFQEGMERNDELKEVLKEIDLPLGFQPKDLLTMLDEDGSGIVNEAEFIEAMFRLIYCNDFQQICLVKLSMNQIKTQIQELRHETARGILESNGRVAKEIEALRCQLSSALNVQLTLPPPDEEPPPEDSLGGASPPHTKGLLASPRQGSEQVVGDAYRRPAKGGEGQHGGGGA